MINKKRIVFISKVLVICMLLLSFSITAFAEKDDNDKDKDIRSSTTSTRQPADISELEMFLTEPTIEMNRAVSLTVKTPCDAQYINAHSSWMYDSNRAVEAADDYLYPLYGVDFYTISQVSFTSTTNPSTTLSNLYNTYNTHANMIMGFVGRNTGSYANLFGMAYVNRNTMLIRDWNLGENKLTILHEASHCWGNTNDDCGTTNCIMDYGTTASSPYFYCTSCKSKTNFPK